MPTTRSGTRSLDRRDDARSNSPHPTDANDNIENGADAGDSFSTPRQTADGTMFSSESVHTIIEALQRSQTEALREVLSSVTRVNASTPIQTPWNQGTLTGCKATFSGKQESVEAFVDAVEAYSECACVSDANIIRGLAYLLKEEAATWWQGIKYQISTWSQAKENLISAYGDRRPPHKIYIEIFSHSQGNENTDVFVARIRSHLARLPVGDVSERAQLDMTYGLLNSRIRKRIRREDFTTFKDLLRRARDVEDSFDETKTAAQVSGRAAAPSTRAPPLPPRSAPPYALGANTPGANTPGANTPGRAPPSRQPPLRLPPHATTASVQGACAAPADTTTKKQRPICAYCRKYGHTKDQCRKLMNLGEPTFNNNSVDRRGISDSDKSEQSFYSVESQPCSSEMLKDSNNPRTTSNMFIQSSNRYSNAKVDCSKISSPNTYSPTSDACNNDRSLFQNYNNLSSCVTDNNDICYQSINTHITACDTISSKCLCLPFETKCLCLPFETKCLCLPSVPKILCECEKYNFTNSVQTNNDVISISGCNSHAGRDSRPIFKIEILGINGTALIDTGAKHCIAGHTLYALLLRYNHPLRAVTQNVKLADGVVKTMEVLTTKLQVRLEREVVTVPFLIFPDATNNETLLGIDFITAAGVVIDFHREIWYFSGNNTVQYNLCFESPSRNVSCAATDVLRDDEGVHLKPAERQALADVLTRYAHVFKAGGAPTPYAEHRIETGEHPPISVPPYRLNPAKKELMKKEIDQMLADDIIEDCESAWSSPALMVPKANGGIRFCVDYRRLNAITKSDTYPMPRIDDLLQSTKQDCYMSTLDLRSSYWQVMVAEADRDKTAFVCPLGTFRFKRMPFEERKKERKKEKFILAPKNVPPKTKTRTSTKTMLLGDTAGYQKGSPLSMCCRTLCAVTLVFCGAQTLNKNVCMSQFLCPSQTEKKKKN
ncbi:uncharacterized protein [Choristoneura fumiferana]|uniref:uncharacterized protein n=1 Tax=Choristoneura fumiferana TaxID=7141 RepID=UPI003D15560D